MQPPKQAYAWSRFFHVPLALIVVDLLLRTQLGGYSSLSRWGLKDLGVYSVATVWSLATWALFWRFLRGTTEKRARTARIVVTAIATPIFGASFGYMVGFDQAPSWQVLHFFVSEPRMAWFIMSWATHWYHFVGFVVLAAGLWYLLRPAGPHVPSGTRLPWKKKLAIGLLYPGLTALVLGAPGFQSPVPIDANTAAALAQYGIAKASRNMHLVAPVRPPIPKQPAQSRPNVLLIVHESLRADAVFPGLTYGRGRWDPRVISPWGSRLPERRADGYFTFPFARTNSTATESSVPVILSGIELGGDTYAYGTAQSVWSVAKATGATTFLFAAEAYTWSHFDEYFIDEHVDKVLTGTELSEAVPTGSAAADDGAVVDAAIAHLETLAQRGQPFVGVVHFDATHLPGWAGPGTPPFTGEHGDSETYERAVRYVDDLCARIEAALEKTGLAQNTVVLATSDHGENIIPKRPPDRLGSSYEHIIRIPFWVRLPAKLQAAHPEWVQALTAWGADNPQNMDVMPTVRDLLGMSAEPALGPKALPGRSLVVPPPADAWISGQSTCAFRAWANESFYLVRGTTKVIVSSEQPNPQIYDLSVDPKEENDLWGVPEWHDRVMPWIESAVAAGQERKELCRRLGSRCPVAQ